MSTLPTAQATYPVSSVAPDTTTASTLVTAGNLPGTAGNPAYSGTFIPQIWSSKLIERFYESTVIAAIANTDYEGEIRSYGDKVIIRMRPSLTINDYSAYGKLSYETPTAPVKELNIDKGKYFGTILDDVMRTQADMNLMDLWASDAAEQMKIAIDRMVLKDLVTKVGTATATDPATGVAVGSASSGFMAGAAAGRGVNNIDLGIIGTPIKLTSGPTATGVVNVIEYILRLGEVLDLTNCPENGRFLVIPPWLAALIKGSELRDASLSGDGVSMLRNGRLGMIDRFELFMSQHLPAGTPTGSSAIFAGTNQALTFASQMTNMETLRAPDTFGTLQRGLQVFGYELLKPECLAMGYVSK